MLRCIGMTLKTLTIEGAPSPATGCKTQQDPSIRHTIDELPLNDFIQINTHFEDFFEKESKQFWKLRTIIQITITPHILSVTFVPISRTRCEILFIQKQNLVKETTGFIAPYFSKKVRAQLGAHQSFTAYHAIHDEKTIDSSLQVLNISSDHEIKAILEHFLKDSQTACLGLTYLYQNTYITHGWIKG